MFICRKCNSENDATLASLLCVGCVLNMCMQDYDRMDVFV